MGPLVTVCMVPCISFFKNIHILVCVTLVIYDRKIFVALAREQHRMNNG
jgi:hypothetical protein